jgi:SAM-dependent methyltransferase
MSEPMPVDRETSPIEWSYDRIARAYADEFSAELIRKPFDADLLGHFAEELAGKGLVCDLGCGPGHIARFMHELGADVCGIDLSMEMVRCARRLNPQIRFQKGDMLGLPVSDASFAAITAFYSIIHLPRERAADALAEMKRVLKPGGKLLMAFHGGEGFVRRDEWYGEEVAVEATLFQPDEMKGFVEKAGLKVAAIEVREPYDFEYPSKRVYLLAMKAK